MYAGTIFFFYFLYLFRSFLFHFFFFFFLYVFFSCETFEHSRKSEVCCVVFSFLYAKKNTMNNEKWKERKINDWKVLKRIAYEIKRNINSFFLFCFTFDLFQLDISTCNAKRDECNLFGFCCRCFVSFLFIYFFFLWTIKYSKAQQIPIYEK